MGAILLHGALQWAPLYCMGPFNGHHFIAWGPSMGATLLHGALQWAPLYCMGPFNGCHFFA